MAWRSLFTSSRARTLLLTLLVAPSHEAKYILFTTQRSGSTWLCDVLRRQPGIECGISTAHNHIQHISEMMMHYSFMKNRVVQGYDYSNITWAKWRADCEAQFALLTRESSGKEKATAIGFKLMYDQVPPRLMSAFVTYVAREHITIIHLEREAVLLQVASHFQTQSGLMHETDAANAAKIRQSTAPLAAPFETVKQMMKQRIAEHDEWKAHLRYAPGVRYYHVAYEHLIGPAAENYLRSVIAFMADRNEDVDLRNVTLASSLYALHESSCRERVAPSLYARLCESFRATSVMGACDMLDELANQSAAAKDLGAGEKRPAASSEDKASGPACEGQRGH